MVRLEWSGTLWGVFHTDVVYVLPLESTSLVIDSSTAQEFFNMCAAMNEKDLYTAASALNLYVDDEGDSLPGGKRFKVNRLRHLMANLCLVAVPTKKWRGHHAVCSCFLGTK